MPAELGPLYKWLDGDRKSCHGGKPVVWPAPTADGPGEWMPAVQLPLVQCGRGYHVLQGRDLITRAAPTLWRVEHRGEVLVCDGEVVVEQARLVRQLPWCDRLLRLFACDCAERVVHLCGDDPRPAQAIAVARRYADGEATEDELREARAVAWDPAWDVARAVAWDAARDAARAAAWAAAWAVAWDAERAWQTAHLLDMLGETADAT